MLTFKRGIHPPDEKKHTKDCPIEYILPKEGALMSFPMSQHLGAPCDPIVAVGDYVQVGQKIGSTEAFVSSPIFSSVSGVVKEIKPIVNATGQTISAVIIENDGKLTEHESIKPRTGFKDLSKQDLLTIIKEAGIVGLGGAGFPTHIKLNPPADKKIDTIIVNAAECEPYLTTDYRIMLEEGDRIVKGLEIMLHIHPEAKGYIGIEDNKPEAIKVMQAHCKGIPNIEVKVLQTKFPQGAEKQLINALTGREVPSGGLPAEVGCIVDNVDTVVAIHRAVFRGRPIMRRIVTISGGAVKNPGNYKVRLGMNLLELLDVIGGFKEEPGKLILGGPMMGPAINNLDAPVVKTSSALVCLTKEEAVLPKERNCIRCGKCVSHCPMGLMPFLLNQNILFDELDEFEKNNGMDCIECGSCSYICPAKRHLAQTMRATKRIVLQNRKK